MQDGVEYKKCSLHDKWFPNEDMWLPCIDEYFYKNSKNSKDGLYPYCKRCSTKKARKWIDENPEKKLESNRKDAKKPQRRKQFRDNSKRQSLEGYQREYRKNNPDKLKRYAEKHRNHDITSSEWKNCQKVFSYQCAYCGKELQEIIKETGQKLHKEHVLHEGNNDISNCVPSCRECNVKKWQFVLDKWYNEQNPNFNKDRYDKIIWWITEGYKDYIEEKPPYTIKWKRNYNDDESYAYNFELWTVDEKRNLLERIVIKSKKKDLEEYINKL